MRTLTLLLLLAAGCSDGPHYECSCLYRPTVTLHVLDAATGQPAELPPGWLQPVFTVGGNNLGTTCGVEADGGSCTSWQFALIGAYTIHITFPGYQAADVAVNVGQASGGCCPAAANTEDKTVSITKQ